MSTFTPDEKIITVMKNFSEINPSMLIKPDELAVINNSNSVIAHYPFDEPFDFKPFGLYNTADALNFIKALSSPVIEVNDKHINMVGSNNEKVKYYVVADTLVPVVPNIDKKFNASTIELDFVITADKLAIMTKMIGLLSHATHIFFETANKQIRITIGDSLTSTLNNMEIYIDDNIKVNQLKDVIKISVVDFKVLAGEYQVKINSKITKWDNLNGVSYYITTS